MFWDRFVQLCKERDLSPNNAIKQITGADKSSSLTYWKNGSLPSASMLIEISHFFNCSVDYLLCISDLRESAEEIQKNGMKLTGEVGELVSYYEGMRRPSQRRLLADAEDLFVADRGRANLGTGEPGVKPNVGAIAG